MVEVIQTFFSYTGLTLFFGGLAFCFIALTFRFGVFCTLLGNIFFIAAIVFPKQLMDFIDSYNLNSYFISVNIDVLKEKAIIFGLIIMAINWGIRWLKHLVVDGFFVFLFPSLVRPIAKDKNALTASVETEQKTNSDIATNTSTSAN